MALFKSIPAVSTQKDTLGPINRKPSATLKDEDLKEKKLLTDEEEDLALAKMVKPLPKEDLPDPVMDDEPILDEEPKKPIKEAPKKEEVKEEKKVAPKEEKVAPKEEKKETSKKEEVKKEAPVVIKEEPQEKEEAKPVIEEEENLTPEEARRRKMMANLEKARLARQQAQDKKENTNMAGTTKAAPKKAAPKPKKAVDMSKMVVSAKKPAATTKTVYHVSKRGETLDDRVWKVFIQESDKVIKLFDYQEEALAYAKQLAKNKNDGSYVILHGLNGKIRKF